jgi:pyruvate dehydrogenase E2 component (dihydrolipoamide acetyltransferase)
MTDILMPALSPTMEEGTLAKWHVKAGDTVSSGDVIAEIETDKATMEVEAVDEGVVEAILVAEGTEGVKVNTPIARLKGEGVAAAPPPAQTAAPPPAAAKSEAPAPAPKPAEKAPPLAALSTGKPSRVYASPLARRLAEQKGVDLSALKGSGPHGRIIKADIDAAQPGAASAKAQSASVSQAAAPPAQVKSLEQLGIAPGTYDLVPLDGMRKVIARRMTESFRDIPHFPLTIDLEIDRLLDARVRINGALEKQGVKISVNDLIIKACAAALKAVPDANASYTPDGISKTMKDLAERARSRKLKPEEFQGGTFSLSNLGMMGIKSFSSILNEPQGCILSVGAGEKRAVVKGDQLAIATVMTVTLTCDHRAVDGAIGARWLAAFKTFIEDPITLLA